MQQKKKCQVIRKLILARDVFFAIPGVFLYPLLVFHNAVSTLFLLLRWKSHNGRYWLLYFLSVYPPLAFVIAEQEDMPDLGAMLSLQNLNIFPLIIWNPVGLRGDTREGRCRGSGCLPVGARTKCQISRSARAMWKVSTASQAIWGRGQVCSLVCTCTVPVAGVLTDMCIRTLQCSTAHNSKAIPLWLRPPLSVWSHRGRGYMQRNYCFSGLIWRPPIHLPRGMFYQCCMWGVTPMAFTHIPLMPAGDVASGVETSRGLGTVNRGETLPGAARASLWHASYL